MKKNAIPSCNLPNAATNKRKKQDENDMRKKRRLQREEEKSQVHSEIENSTNTTNLELLDQDNAHGANESNLDESTLNESTLNESNPFLPSEKKLSDFSTQMTSGDLILDSFDTIKTDSERNMLTEIANFKILNTLIKIVEIGYAKYKSKTMNLRSKIVMTFMKLKHNVSYAILRALFKYASVSQCRKIILGMIDKLQNCLRSAVYFPNKEEIFKNIPLCFRDFADARIVLDCTEMHIQKPKELCCQQATYSRYKSDFTIEFMTGVTPGGMISFVSKAYGGKISEDAIFKQSNILYLFEKGDAIMVDKGFRIDKLCTKKR